MAKHRHWLDRPGPWRANWVLVRRGFIAAGNDFCCVCGRRDRLEVHHIVPTRAGGTSQHGNLVTLCRACHGRLERYSRRILAIPFSMRRLAVQVLQAHLADLWHLHQGRKQPPPRSGPC